MARAGRLAVVQGPDAQDDRHESRDHSDLGQEEPMDEATALSSST